MQTEADRQLRRFTMELVDQLLAILADPNPRYATQPLMAAGHSDDEVRGAWNFARSAGFTASSGLGADRLTGAGRKRATEIARVLAHSQNYVAKVSAIDTINLVKSDASSAWVDDKTGEAG